MYKKFLFGAVALLTIFGIVGFSKIVLADTISEQKIYADDSHASYSFGTSVDVDGNYMVVGAENANNLAGRGAAYIYFWDGTSWVQQQKIVPNDAWTSDSFGHSVAISGEYIVVGAYGKSTKDDADGAVYVFHKIGTTWTQQAKLVASDGQFNDFMGRAVDISGDFIVAGADNDDDLGENSGSAYVFHRVGTTWTQQAKLKAIDGGYNNLFGSAVAIYGNDILIGAYWNNDGRGAAYLFNYNGSTWTQQQKIVAFDGQLSDRYAKYVDINSNYIVIASPSDDYMGSDSGSVYVYQRNGTNVVFQNKLYASTPISADNFGTSLALDGDNILVGAYAHGCCNNPGALYFFQNQNGAWNDISEILSDITTGTDLFAYDVALNGNNLVAGRPGDDTKGIEAGAVSVFHLILDVPQVGDLKGKVWYDENGNGNRDTSETYELKNIYISLYKDVDNSHSLTSGDTLLATQNSGNGLNNGSYMFGNLPVGDYLIQIDRADSDLNNSAINANRVYGLTTREVIATPVVAGQVADNLDFGFDEVEVRAFVSTNSIYESGVPTAEATLSFGILPISAFGITVNLSYSGDATSNIDYTKVESIYLPPFSSLTSTSSTSFVIKAIDDTIPESSELINVNVVSVSGAKNSIASPIVITIYDNDPIISQHGISGNIWVDNNTNGLKDIDDVVGLKNVEVKLYKDTDNSHTLTQTDNLVDTVNSDVFGNYSFNNLIDDSYIIVVNNASVTLKNDLANGNKTYGLTTFKELSLVLNNEDLSNNNFGFAIAKVSMTVDKSTISEDPTLGNSTNVTLHLSVPTAFETGMVFAYGGTAQAYMPVATANLDYTKFDYISIPAGSTTASFVIKAVQDTLPEYPEVFNVELVGAVNSSIDGLLKYTVVIYDDSCTLDFGISNTSPKLMCKTTSPSSTNGRSPGSNFSNLPSRLPEQAKLPVLPVQSKAPLAPIKQSVITKPAQKQVCSYVRNIRTRKLTYTCK